MKLVLSLFVVVMTFVPNLSWAQSVNSLPFASELTSEIRHYNRATSTLATSGTPSNGAYKELAGKGVNTFIDLRNIESVTSAARLEAEEAGAVYHNIPVYGSNGISKEQVAEFAKIYEETEGLILVNCGSGNRVGALWSAYQMSKDVSHDVAIQEGRTMGMKMSLEQDVKSKFCTDC